MPFQLPEPLIPNAANQMSSYRDGYAIGRDQQQTQTMQQAGGMAADGDTAGAANAMMRGGLISEGQKMLDQLQQHAAAAKEESLAAASKKMDTLALLAERTPNEQWPNAIAKAQELGLIDPALAKKYADPSTKDIAIAQSSKASEIMKNELASRRLDNSEAVTSVRADAAAAKADSNAASSLSDDAIKQTAETYIATGQMPALGQGSKEARAKVLNKVAEITGQTGQSANDIVNNKVEMGARTAGARTSGVQEAKMTTAAQEITNLAPIALEKMHALAGSRGKFLPFNQLVEMYQKGTNDTRVLEAQAANTAVITNYAAVMGRGSAQLTDDARRHAEELLKTAFDEETYIGVVKTLQREAEQSKKAPAQVREQNRLEHGGMVAAPAAAASGPQAGHVEGGYRFKGGDPADKASWEKVN